MSTTRELRCVYSRVIGRVQGVGFRWFVVDHAERLRLRGWVRNAEDGRTVEILAVGPEARLRELMDTVRQGPPGSRVEDVEVEWRAPDQSHTTFEIRR
jgi:acylphosphatase